MTKEEIYNERQIELKPLIFALQAAIELHGRDKAKQLAKAAFDKYADDRFVQKYGNVPLDDIWHTFRNSVVEYADDVQYSIDVQEANRIKIKYHWCSFLEIFKDHGLADFVPLYCDTDFATCRKIHPGITLTRTQILADGGSCCDHCWTFNPE